MESPPVPRAGPPRGWRAPGPPAPRPPALRLSERPARRSESTRRTLLRPWVAAGLTSAAVLLAGCGGTAQGERPNLLFVLVDQQRGDALGADGHPRVRTPHLDLLAAEGVRFARAYVQAPLCAPSRASLFTARPPLLHRVTNNTCRLPEDQVTWAHHLRAAGYETVAVGRTHGIYDGCRWERVVPDLDTQLGRVPAAEHWDALIADRAIDELEALAGGDRPFALYVGFFSPHAPYAAPEPWDDAYAPGPWRVDAAPEAGAAAETRWQRSRHASDYRDLSPAERARRVAQYSGLVSFVDAQLGRLLGALDRLERADDTLVLYLSDHGDNLGEHAQFGKNASFFEGEVRVPAVLRWPGHLPAGRVVEPPVETIDVVATAVALVAGSVPGAFVGADRTGLVVDGGAGEAAAPRPVTSFIDFVHQGDPDARGLMVRTGRYKLAWYTNGEGELYDLERDPRERENLFRSPEHVEVWRAHWQLLVEHLLALLERAPPEHADAEWLREEPFERIETDGVVRGAAVRAGGLELRATLGGGRWLLDAGAGEPVAPDEGARARLEELERLLVRRLARGMARPNAVPESERETDMQPTAEQRAAHTGH